MKEVLTRPRRHHLVLAVALIVAALAAATATSADAARKPAPKTKVSLTCVGLETGASMFSSLTRLAPATSTARSIDSRTEKDTSAYSGDSTIPSGSEPATSSSFTASIPVYFHVVTAGSTGYVSKATVKEQMNVLNLAFSGFYGGVNTGFRFTLAGLDYTNNAEWFALETFSAEVAMKTALKRGPATALNIYSTSGGGYLGWAYYPSIVKYQHYEVLDGVQIHYGSLPGGFISRFNLGHTATHEVGHYLGLAHTFDKDCRGQGDYVADTPAMAIPTSGCPIGKDTCPEPGFDPIHNYMDYSDDACYNQFTAGQSTRMQEQWSFWRVKKGYHQN